MCYIEGAEGSRD